MGREATGTTRSALILVVEDEWIPGIEIELALLSAGHRVEGPVTSCAAARTWLGANRPDFAVVDAELDDGFCESLARDLGESGVPFVVCSDRTDLTAHEALAAAPRLIKPIDLTRLVEVVDLALSRGEVQP